MLVCPFFVSPKDPDCPASIGRRAGQGDGLGRPGKRPQRRYPGVRRRHTHPLCGNLSDYVVIGVSQIDDDEVTQSLGWNHLNHELDGLTGAQRVSIRHIADPHGLRTACPIKQRLRLPARRPLERLNALPRGLLQPKVDLHVVDHCVIARQ